MYFLSAIEDHIAPWKTTFLGTDLVGGDVEFVLGGSGHIAGVINPPAKIKEITGPMVMGQSADWLETATAHQDLGGSLAPVAGSIPFEANTRTSNWYEYEFKEIVPAPGDYVRVRL